MEEYKTLGTIPLDLKIEKVKLIEMFINLNLFENKQLFQNKLLDSPLRVWFLGPKE